MKRLPPVTSSSTILVTVTLPMRHFISAPLIAGRAGWAACIAPLHRAEIARQVQFDRCSASRLAIDDAAAAETRDEAIHLRQSKAGSLARLLGREERVEGLVADLRRHPGSGVADRDRDIVPGRDARVRIIRGFVDLAIDGFNRQAAASLHRV